MVLGPASEVITYILFAPASAYLVLEAWVRRGAVLRRLAVTAAFGLFTIAQLALWFPGGSRINDLAPYPVATLLMTAALAAAAVWRLIAHPSAVPASPERRAA
jgi:hypothetical protein